MSRQFLLDPSVTFLNHGSFGATPRPVFAAYRRWQREMEREPVEFLARRATGLLAQARARLALFLGTAPQNLVFVTNTTTGVNMVARSLKLSAGDEVLTTDHEYGALDRTWDYLAAQRGFAYRHYPVTLPLTTPESFVDELWSQVTPRTRVLYVSHITSPTALIFPVQEICRRAREAGILSVVDGAHVAGQLPLQLEQIGADVYIGNLHKWLCAPKGCAFLYARPEAQELFEPLIMGWGWRGPEPSPSPLIDLYQDQGTRDLAPFLSVTAALDFVETQGWSNVRRRCHALAGRFQQGVSAITGIPLLHPDDPAFYGMMAAAPLPPLPAKKLHAYLFDRHRIEIPVGDWNGRQMIRASFFVYSRPRDLDHVLEVLPEAIAAVRA